DGLAAAVAVGEVFADVFDVEVGHGSLRIGDAFGELVEGEVEAEADEADDQDGEDDAAEVEVVPVGPGHVADAKDAEEHFGGDDSDEGAAEGNAQAGDSDGGG